MYFPSFYQNLTCLKKFLANCSSKTPFSVMKSKRSLQGSGLSMIIIKLSTLSKQSTSFTMPGLFLRIWRRLTSSGTLSSPTYKQKNDNNCCNTKQQNIKDDEDMEYNRFYPIMMLACTFFTFFWQGINEGQSKLAD